MRTALLIAGMIAFTVLANLLLKSGAVMRSSSSWVGGLSSPCSHFSSVLPLTKSSSM